MVKSNVRAFVRTRPTASNFDGLKVQPDGCSISVQLPKEANETINNKQDTFAFKFDGVLENVSQETLYHATAAEVVDSVLAGYSGCVFAYGQTGAGKTFTMSGDLRNYAHRGVIPRAVHQVFREIDMRVDKLYEVQVSYLEIYNEQMYDLLAEQPGSSSEGLAVMEDAHQGTYVRGLTRVTVHSEEEALAQYFVGEQGRSTAQHVLNAASSRSHCVFSLHLRIRTSEAANERAVVSRLHLVDLAGSERTKKTNATGQTLKEAQFINKSLSFLEQTVNALARHDSHVPFRQSRLTSVLRDALGGNCKTVMIANIWGEAAHLEETLSTLRFASRVRCLTSNLTVAESTDAGMLLKRYERQVKELKQELAMRDALSGKARVNYDDLGDADIRELQALAKRFVQGEADVEELPSDSLRRIREMYRQLRVVASSAQDEAAQRLVVMRAEVEAAAAHAATGLAIPGSAHGRVGDVDADSRGFQVGVAPAELRPAKGIQPLVGPGALAPTPLPGHAHEQLAGAHTAGQLTAGAFEQGNGEGDLTSTVTLPGGPERNEAFARYKHNTEEGRSLNGVVKERMAQLKGVKIAIKEAAATVNSCKASIDSLTARLAGTRGTVADGMLDAEHHTLAQELKSSKASYLHAFDALKDMRCSLEPLAASVAEAKQELIAEFDKWLAANGPATLAPMGGEEDELDAGEAFERMQMGRVTATDPDSLAYHTAMRKTTAQPLRSSGVFGGSKAAADATRKQEHVRLINAGLAK